MGLRQALVVFDTSHMLQFTGFAAAVALVIGWLVTHRLFRLARKTGAAPERLLAIAFCGLFCIGYPLAAASRAPGLGETYQGSLIFAIAMLGMVTGLAAWLACAQIAVILMIRACGVPILAPVPMLVIAVSSLVGPICWWLAFFTPDAYRGRLERAGR